MSALPADDYWRTFEEVPERAPGLAKGVHDALLAAGWTVYASRSRYGGWTGKSPLGVWYLPPGETIEHGVGFALMAAAAKQIEADG